MLITKYVKIKPHCYLQYYKNLGYDVNKGSDIIEIKVEDLLEKSSTLIECKCDVCGYIKNIKYVKYNKNIKKYNLYTCSQRCAQLKNKKTNLERYGVEHPQSLEIIKNKTKETNLKNIGYEYYLQSDFFKDKMRQTFIQKYNTDNPMKTEYVRNKVKTTNLERYGVENVLSNYDIKNKIKNTNLERYGVEFINQNKFLLQKGIEKRSRETINKMKKILNNDDYCILQYNKNIFLINHLSCDKNFEINWVNLYDRIRNKHNICTECYPIGDNKSIKEKELINWIKELDINFIESDKTVLKPKHLDIYVPSHNLGIEMNGLYHHSEIFKDKNYHLEKSLKCLEQGIQLLHIWEDEWVYKKDIIKSIILNRLGLIKEKIYARQCEIRVIEDSKLVRQFLDENHIQGYSQSSIKLGLFYQNELVSLMTFGYRHTNAKKEFELIRFCNRINLNVIGSASKLFNYFKQNYHFTELISYSDFRLFDGSMYQTLGFTKQHLSKPDYFWCKNLERKHRFNFNKQKLIKEGFDGSKTEVEIMHDRGYFRIFGCGQYRWLFKNI
jgi:hypothetical protein